MVLVHLAAIVSAYVLSFYLRFDFVLDVLNRTIIYRSLPLLLIIKMTVFYFYGLFFGLWRYAGIDDIWRIIKANFISTLLFISAVTFIHIGGYPRSVFFLDWILCTSFVSGLRFVTRLFREHFRPMSGKRAKRILIVGAGTAGVMVLKECRNNPGMGVEVAGFVDDDPRKKNLRIQGVKILGTRRDLADIVRQYGIEEIVIAIPSASGEVIRDIISHCEKLSVRLKILPGLHKILTGDLEIRPREVKPEDLLGRKAVEINEREIRSYIEDQCVLVTGAAGSVGSAICKHLTRFGPKRLLLLDYNENNVYFLAAELKIKYPHIEYRTVIGDVKDVGLLKRLFSDERPEVVFHAAAHKHVPLMEESPHAAVKNNVLASRNLMYAAHHYKVERFVLISTDKAVNPTSVMGATKRIAEMILQSKAQVSSTKFMAVRFGNVIGSDGSVVPLFKKQIEDGGPVTVTHPEVTRYFMSVNEAAMLVLQTGAIGKGGEVFVLDMGEPIKIADLARELITLSGFEPGREIPIDFIGLRPGEKLYEETLLRGENEKATRYEKIFITQPYLFDALALRRQVRELGRLANRMEHEKIVAQIKRIVPEYSAFNGRVDNGKRLS